MKARVYKTICLIIALVVAVFTVGYAFAWLIDRRNSPFELSGASAGAYFDSTSGDGKSPGPGHAFIIANPTHMRNLAVLQNTGRFRGEKYYFEIKESVDEIDMDGLWLPPIGNDEHPFIGVFNGKGKTIKNLKVTTDKSKLTKEMYPIEASDSYEFSNAVGLFGNTDGTDCQIRNFILDNPVLLVGGKSSTKYSAGANKVVGLAVGHVEGLCQSIGVRATNDKETYLQIVDANTKYSTFNSILGELGEGVESSVTGGGHTAGTGGSGAAFGSSFDVEDLLARLQKIDANKKSSTPSWRLPDIDTGTNVNPVPAELRKVPFAVTEESTYEGADAIEVVSNQNIGYFIGNQNKIMTSKELTFDPPMTLSGNEWVMQNNKNVPRWFYKYTTQSGSYDTSSQSPSYDKTVFKPLTQAEFDELPQGIIDLLPPNVGNKERFTAVRLSQSFNNTGHPFYNNSVGGWSFHGQINIMGKTYGKGFMGTDGKVVDENGQATGDMLDQWGQRINFYSYEEGIYLPNNAVWFKPQQLGKIKFVMYAEKAEEGFSLIKITREGATKENPFYSAPNTTGWGRGDDIFFEEVMKTRLPSGVLLYFEHEVDATELAANNVEYMIMQYGDGGAQFLYLDLGASAAEDTSAVVPEKVSAVDFIYTGVEISQTDVADTDIKIGDFIVNTSGTVARYDASKTSIYFENLTTVLKIVYVRLHNEAGKHAGKTICLEGSTPALDTSSEVHATFATYVCPTISGGSGTVGGGGGTVTPTPGPEDVAVSGVAISGAPKTMSVGGTATLSATVSPNNATNKTVSWTTSNSSIATVSNGVVTAKAAGTVTITATAGGKSDSVTITVTGGTSSGNVPAGNLTSELTGSVSGGSKICDNDYITATLSGGSVTVTETSATAADGTTFDSYLFPGGGNRTYTFNANQKVKVIIYYTVMNKDSVRPDNVTATVTESGGATRTITSSDGTRTDGTAYKMEVSLEAGDSFVLASAGNRLVIYGIFLSE